MSKEMIVFNNISFTPKQQVLFGVSSNLKPKRMTAIIGPSGSGKTTLIRILTGRFSEPYTGEIFYDQKLITKKQMLKKTAFVYQDDVLLPYLTVRETLTYVCKLRNKKLDLKIVDTLGIAKILDSYVGTSTKGISAGERKRICIALELIDNPKIMFLDEPTSGLDSLTALNLIKYLKNLSSESSIVSTIHQPSAYIFFMFDDLILLDKGKIVYDGPIKNVLKWFEYNNFNCPTYCNPADFIFTDVLPALKDKKGLVNNYNEICLQEEAANITDEETAQIKKDSNVDKKIKINNSDFNEDKYYDNQEITRINCKNNDFSGDKYASRESIDEDETLSEDKTFVKTRSKQKNSFLTKLFILSNRNLYNMYRNRMIGLARIFQSTFTAVIIGFVFFNNNNKEDAVRSKNIQGVLYFIAMNCLYASAMTSLSDLYKSKLILIREYHAGYYKFASYFCAKLLLDSILNIIHPIILVPIVLAMIGYQFEFIKISIILITAILTTLSGYSIAVLTASIFTSLSVASTVLPCAILPLTVLSGLLIDPETMNIFLKGLQYLSTSRYGYNILIKNEFQGQNIDSPTLKSMVDGFHGIKTCLGLMILLILANVVIAYFSLRKHIRKSI